MFLAARFSGACSHCKGLKVKCHFTQGQTSCTRCSQSNIQCVVSGRKKRRAVAYVYIQEVTLRNTTDMSLND